MNTVNPSAPAAAPTALTGQQRLAIFVSLLGLAVVCVDGALLNLALPAVARQLQVSASASIGVNITKTNYDAESSTPRPSSVTAGRDVIAVAGQDINIVGSQIYGGRDVILDAGRDLNIVAAKGSGDSDYSQTSGGGGVGVKFAYGSGGAALGINVYANASGSTSDDEYANYMNSHIFAGDTLSTSSGRDTNVIGANLEADRVWMDVGNNLTVASIQDTYDSKSQSWNAGVNVTIGYGYHMNLDLGFGQGKENSDWVGQQTSIVGHSEVDIYTDKNTHNRNRLAPATHLN